MSLLQVIDTFEKAGLHRLSDTCLSQAQFRAEVMIAHLDAEKTAFWPVEVTADGQVWREVTVRRSQLLAISQTITTMLTIRYGCND